MQGTHDMTLDTEQLAPSGTRTTAAGLEAWLSGAYAPATHVAAITPALDIETPLPEANAAVVGPVNAAEALALSLVQATFSSGRRLTGPDGAELVVDPERNAYYFESTSLKPLAVLLQQPASAWIPIYSEALKAAREANEAQPLERLRWYAGLIATPGILSRNLSHAAQFKLSGWPETEREFPKHFRLAKEMLKDDATVEQIVAGSGMPFEEVVDYINASFAAGRIAAAPGKGSDHGAASPSRRKGLMARLNKPLFAR